MLRIVYTLLPLAMLCSAKVKVLNYGQYSGLSIECAHGELIRVESEKLGYSPYGQECDPRPPCEIPYTLAKWYCRGKNTCTGLQVERRPLQGRTCGSEFTNCLRVEYSCIKSSLLTDICRETRYSAEEGHIVSPRFPIMYPPKQNCTCSLVAENGKQVHITNSFFLLKASEPCKDWLNIALDTGRTVHRCGYLPQQERYVTSMATIDFYSDDNDQGMGFWIGFRGTQRSSVTVKCGQSGRILDKQISSENKVQKSASRKGNILETEKIEVIDPNQYSNNTHKTINVKTHEDTNALTENDSVFPTLSNIHAQNEKMGIEAIDDNVEPVENIIDTLKNIKLKTEVKDHLVLQQDVLDMNWKSDHPTSNQYNENNYPNKQEKDSMLQSLKNSTFGGNGHISTKLRQSSKEQNLDNDLNLPIEDISIDTRPPIQNKYVKNIDIRTENFDRIKNTDRSASHTIRNKFYNSEEDVIRHLDVANNINISKHTHKDQLNTQRPSRTQWLLHEHSESTSDLSQKINDSDINEFETGFGSKPTTNRKSPLTNMYNELLSSRNMHNRKEQMKKPEKEVDEIYLKNSIITPNDPENSEHVKFLQATEEEAISNDYEIYHLARPMKEDRPDNENKQTDQRFPKSLIENEQLEKIFQSELIRNINKTTANVSVMQFNDRKHKNPNLAGTVSAQHLSLSQPTNKKENNFPELGEYFQSEIDVDYQEFSLFARNPNAVIQQQSHNSDKISSEKQQVTNQNRRILNTRNEYTKNIQLPLYSNVQLFKEEQEILADDVQLSSESDILHQSKKKEDQILDKDELSLQAHNKTQNLFKSHLVNAVDNSPLLPIDVTPMSYELLEIKEDSKIKVKGTVDSDQLNIANEREADQFQEKFQENYRQGRHGIQGTYIPPAIKQKFKVELEEKTNFKNPTIASDVVMMPFEREYVETFIDKDKFPETYLISGHHAGFDASKAASNYANKFIEILENSKQRKINFKANKNSEGEKEYPKENSDKISWTTFEQTSTTKKEIATSSLTDISIVNLRTGKPQTQIIKPETSRKLPEMQRHTTRQTERSVGGKTREGRKLSDRIENQNDEISVIEKSTTERSITNVLFQRKGIVWVAIGAGVTGWIILIAIIAAAVHYRRKIKERNKAMLFGTTVEGNHHHHHGKHALSRSSNSTQKQFLHQPLSPGSSISDYASSHHTEGEEPSEVSSVGSNEHTQMTAFEAERRDYTKTEHYRPELDLEKAKRTSLPSKSFQVKAEVIREKEYNDGPRTTPQSVQPTCVATDQCKKSGITRKAQHSGVQTNMQSLAALENVIKRQHSHRRNDDIECTYESHDDTVRKYQTRRQEERSPHRSVNTEVVKRGVQQDLDQEHIQTKERRRSNRIHTMNHEERISQLFPLGKTTF